MVLVFLIGAGGFFGSILRYLVYEFTTHMFGTVFPLWTIFVNVLGSFFLGYIYSIPYDVEWLTPQGRLMFGIGFLGSFTTFSTFSLDIVKLFERGMYLLCFTYLFLSLFLSIFAVLCGMYFGKNY